MTATDEAQSLPRVSVVFDPPLEPSDPHEFAQALLERICTIPAATLHSAAYKRLVHTHATLTRLTGEDLSHRTTYEEDSMIAGHLEEFAAAFAQLVTKDLSRKAGLDLATTLVPVLTHTKE